MIIIISDELGNVVAWRRSDSEFIEYENIHNIHLNSSSITTVAACRFNDTRNFIVFIQVKSGSIYQFQFNEISGFKEVNDYIPCGTFTFCRMSVLKLDGEKDDIILAYPSVHFEAAINVIKIENEGKRYLLKDYLIQGSGMCLFTKLKQLKYSRILLICGYESGKVLVLNCEDGHVIFDGKCFEGGESCTDADLYEEENGLVAKLVVVGTGNVIKVINDFNPTTTISIILPFPGCNSVVIRSDGKLFVTGGWDCKLRFFSLKNFKPLAVIDYHFDAVNDVKIREEDFSIIAASSDGTISIWTLFTC